MQEYFSSFLENFANSVPSIFSALLILIISYYGGVLLSRLLRGVLERQNADAGVTHLLTKTLQWTIIILGFITALQKFFNVTAFLTGLGIVGFTVGFALQNIMQNFVSGVILLVQRPFRVGDAVGIAGYDGTVLKIGLRTTEIKALDGRIIFLPNAEVLSQPIINYSRASARRVELSIRAAYDSNPHLIRSVILNELRHIKGYLDTPAPQVVFHTFGDSSIDLTVFFWEDTSAASPLAAKDEALTRIKAAFEKNKIKIPYPTQVQLQEMPAAPKRKSK